MAMDILNSAVDCLTKEGKWGQVLVGCSMAKGDEGRRDAECRGKMRDRPSIWPYVMRFDHHASRRVKDVWLTDLQRVDHPIDEADNGQGARHSTRVYLLRAISRMRKEVGRDQVVEKV